MRVAVLGATGYTGLVLLRLLADHPDVDDIVPVSSSRPGERLDAVDPGLSPAIAEKLTSTGGKLATLDEVRRLAEKHGIDVVFSALPHLKSAEVCAPFIGTSVVIDLSADFRFADAAVFASVYGHAHPRPDLLPRAVYGLAEWHTEKIRTADIIANPGCYPTATLLPLLPLARAGLVDGPVVANAISGISGAGKKERLDLLYCERTENAGAYNPGRAHRHAPEIEGELQAERASLSLLFTPHLAPIKRGMCVTTVVRLAKDVPEEGPGSVGALLAAAYEGRPFIRLDGLPGAADPRHLGLEPLRHRVAPRGRQPAAVLRHRQPREGRLGPGGAEHEPPVRPRRGGRPAPARAAVAMTRDLVVVKIGGRAAADEQRLREMAAEMAALAKGRRFLLVHGGGAEVTAVSKRFGIEATFRDGVRMTSPAEMDIVDMVLSGRANKALVRLLASAGLAAVGLSGSDGPVFTARPIGGDASGGDPHGRGRRHRHTPPRAAHGARVPARAVLHVDGRAAPGHERQRRYRGVRARRAPAGRAPWCSSPTCPGCCTRARSFPTWTRHARGSWSTRG